MLSPEILVDFIHIEKSGHSADKAGIGIGMLGLWTRRKALIIHF
jgi:hypothetical protein